MVTFRMIWKGPASKPLWWMESCCQANRSTEMMVGWRLGGHLLTSWEADAPPHLEKVLAKTS